MSAPEPPWGGEAPPKPAAPAAPAPRALPARREVTRADLEALIEGKFDVKARRGEQREARCPAHEDKRASLGLKIVPNDDGGDKVVVKCQAGCPTQDVLAAVGLTFADLFTVEAKPSGAKRGSGLGREDTVYGYADEGGVVRFEVVRFEPKDFRQRTVHPDGTRTWGIKGVRRTLYKLPRVLEAVRDKRLLWIVEGEKDVETLTALGWFATCNMGGAASGENDRKWLPEYAESLAGAGEVVIVPDNDEPGRRHAATIAASLKGKADEVTILDLAKFWPECPVKGDVSAFLAAHPGVEGAAKLAEFLAAAKKPVELVKAELVPGEGVVLEAKPDAGDKQGRGDWRALGEGWEVMAARLISKIDRAGVLHVDPCPYNAGLVLDAHPEFVDRVRYDEFANKIRFRPPSWWLPPLVDRFWDESDTVHFRMWADKGLCPQSPTHFGRETVEEAVLAVGKHHVCHPLREWLEGLEWDGKERLPFWLEHFCGAEAGRYTEAVGCAWMVSAVARIFEPGCQADHMLVLRGPQGIKKTSLFRVLGGEYYASMQGVKLEDKDAKQKLLGKWIVEFAELEALHKSDVSTIKAYLTEVGDHFRLPYRRDFVEFARQCVFAGTINQGEFLKDETGNRRFWIVECGTPEIDVKRLAGVRAQLFAEAVARYRKSVAARERGDKDGEERYGWWLSRADEELAKAVQEENLTVGAYDELVGAWLESDSRLPGSMLAEAETIGDVRYVTAELVVQHAMGREKGRWTMSEVLAVTAAMKRAGWRAKRLRTPGEGRAGRVRRLWSRPEDPQQSLPTGETKDGPDDLPY